MNEHWTVLVTGPISGLERWCTAATEAGWEAIAFPLLEVARVDAPELVDSSAPRPDWVAVTSANAIPALVDAVAARPALRDARFVAVGQATAEQAVESGLPEPLTPAPGAQDARGLAETLASHAKPGERVLWPRGDRARELAERLRAAELLVDDPIVYRTVAVELKEEPPHADVVFFASPSAVAAWNAPARSFAPAAIAIGWTTFEALDEVEEHFSMRIPLVTPSMHAFQDCLQSFVPAE